MTVVEDTLRSMNDRINNATYSNIIVGTTANRFKILNEELDYVDSLNINQPVMVFEELMGISPFFRFDYDRFDYGRLGDVGGMDDLEVV